MRVLDRALRPSLRDGADRLRARRAPRAPTGGTTVPPVPIDHEEVVVRRGRRSGLQMAAAIHSTTLGPALGGVRLWRYATVTDGVRDALRLSRGMTLKAAAAGLDLGGGKAVVCAPEQDPRLAGAELRRAALEDFGDLVDSLGGRYITAEDVGVSAGDLTVVAERTPHVVGLPVELGGAGDPSPFTARGVVAAMRACVAEAFGTASLGGLDVVVVGAGHVGEQLARLLAKQGARLALSDVDARKRALASALGARWVDPEQAMTTSCDVLAPCALGGAIDRSNVSRLDCRIVCGSANNMLASDELAAALAARGILYAPDFIANAGGLISVYRELRGFGPAVALELVDGIEEAVARVLTRSRRERVSPLASAHELARERLEPGRPAAVA